MTKKQALYNVNLKVTDDEIIGLDKFILENGFKNRAEFIRVALNAYMDEEIFRPRFHNPKIKIDQWEKRDITRRKVKEFFDSLNPPEESETFGGWNFKGGRVVLNTDRQKIQLFFDEAPDTETLQIIRINHFTWKPQVKAWEKALRMSAVKRARNIECIKPL
jgi:hypothetical protein